MVFQVDLSAFLPLIMFSLIYAPLYVAISLGFNILFSSTRIINIAYGDFIMLGAYTAYWLYSLYSIPPTISIFIAATIGVAISYILYRTMFRKILESKIPTAIEVQSIIATFGLSIAIQGIVAYIWSPAAVSYTYLDEGITLGSLLIPINLFLIMSIGVTATIIIYAFLYKSYLGIALRGVIQAPQLAEDIGLDINKVYLIATITSLVLPFIAGAAISMRVMIYPFMGVEYLVLALVITALGGLGNPLGSFVGALTYAIMDSLISYFLPPGLKLFYLYMLFLLILLIRPVGILGRPQIVR
jgi:branched-chain amino acid transport system permease protein